MQRIADHLRANPLTVRRAELGLASCDGAVYRIGRGYAAEPKVNWPMPQQDALDVIALISYVHRKLDGAKTCAGRYNTVE